MSLEAEIVDTSMDQVNQSVEPAKQEKIEYFEELFDKMLATDIKIIKWCPKMDLVAIVTADNAVWINRLNWQKLWNLTSNDRLQYKSITAVTWKPDDGKVLATAHEDGSIILWSIETGEPFHTAKNPKMATGPFIMDIPITYIDWIKEVEPPSENSSDQSLYVDRASVFFPPAKALSESSSSSSFQHAEIAKTTQMGGAKRPSSLNMLLTCSTDGTLALYAFGTFFIGSLNLRQLMEPKFQDLDLQEFNIISSTLSSDLHQLMIVTEVQVFQKKSKQMLKQVYTLSVNTQLLYDRRREINEISWQCGSITELIGEIGKVLAKIHNDWQEGYMPFITKLADFQKVLNDEDSLNTIQQDLLNYLLTGIPSSPFQNFLAHNLKDQGLKKVVKSLEIAFAKVNELVMDFLKPNCELLTYKISEFKSHSAWTEKFGALGLNETLADSILRPSATLLLKIEALIKLIVEQRLEYTNFLQWISKIHWKIVEDQPDRAKQIQVNNSLLIKFIRHQLGNLNVDPLGQYFIDQPLSMPLSSSVINRIAGRWGLQDTFYDVAVDHSLVSVFNELKEQSKKVLATPSETICSTMNLVSALLIQESELSPDPDSFDPNSITARPISFYLPEKNDADNAVYWAACKPGNQSPFDATTLLLFKRYSKPNQVDEWFVTGLSLEPEEELISFSFYQDGTLLTLTKTGDVTSISMIDYADLDFEEIALRDANQYSLFKYYELVGCLPFNNTKLERQIKTRNIENVEPIGLFVSGGRGLGSVLALANPLRVIAYDFNAENVLDDEEAEAEQDNDVQVDVNEDEQMDVEQNDSVNASTDN
jgi:hypothetical protein